MDAAFAGLVYQKNLKGLLAGGEYYRDSLFGFTNKQEATGKTCDAFPIRINVLFHRDIIGLVDSKQRLHFW